MNDIALDQFGDFTKDWNLVTVRFRKDSEEMRFTYANKIAFEALKNNKFPIPDGAVFAKVGLITAADPNFISSVVPDSSRRFQFMVKDKNKYRDTDGWGYALFSSEGDLYPDNVKTQTTSCHACHKLVPGQDYVFSKYVELSPFQKARSRISESPVNSRLKFAKALVQGLPKKVKAGIPPKYKYIWLVEGEMTQHMFSGTMNEIRPELIQKANKEMLPAALIGENNRHYVVAFPGEENSKCDNEKKAVTVISHAVVNHCGK